MITQEIYQENSKDVPIKMEHLSKKISEIANFLTQHNNIDDIGLFSGAMGEALFHFEYDRVFKNLEAYNRGIEIIDEIFEHINNGKMFHTFCTGLAGVGWGIEYLSENKFIENKVRDSLSEIDDFIGEMMINDIENGNYDFLHGASGCIIYLLKRRNAYPEKIDKYIVKYLNVLEKTAVKTEVNEIKWLSKINTNDGYEYGYNISLSHGITSIIAVLSKIYVNQIEQELTLSLAKKSVNYLLNQRIDNLQNICCFPSLSIESETKLLNSRLSWCYGDLGISAALWMSGKNFRISSWMKIAEEVAIKSTQRKKEYTGVNDSGICHGASGNSQIYKRMFLNTNNKLFYDASEFWLNETLNMANFKDGLAGYKAYLAGQEDNWVNESGLLTGVSGIGLSLLSYFSESPSPLDEILLIN